MLKFPLGFYKQNSKILLHFHFNKSYIFDYNKIMNTPWNHPTFHLQNQKISKKCKTICAQLEINRDFILKDMSDFVFLIFWGHGTSVNGFLIFFFWRCTLNHTKLCYWIHFDVIFLLKTKTKNTQSCNWHLLYILV